LQLADGLLLSKLSKAFLFKEIDLNIGLSILAIKIMMFLEE
jgi:hypothetical protein